MGTGEVGAGAGGACVAGEGAAAGVAVVVEGVAEPVAEEAEEWEGPVGKKKRLILLPIVSSPSESLKRVGNDSKPELVAAICEFPEVSRALERCRRCFCAL